MAGSRWVGSVEAGMGQRHVLRSVKLLRVLASPTSRPPSLKSCRTIRDVKKRNFNQAGGLLEGCSYGSVQVIQQDSASSRALPSPALIHPRKPTQRSAGFQQQSFETRIQASTLKQTNALLKDAALWKKLGVSLPRCRDRKSVV